MVRTEERQLGSVEESGLGVGGSSRQNVTPTGGNQVRTDRNRRRPKVRRLRDGSASKAVARPGDLFQAFRRVRDGDEQATAQVNPGSREIVSLRWGFGTLGSARGRTWKCECGKEGKKCERTHSDPSRFRSTKCGANLIGRESKDHVKGLEGVEHRDLSFLKARGATGRRLPKSGAWLCR